MKVTIFWHRRDIRMADNAGLYHALKSNSPVLPLFIFDKNILDKLENKQDKRVAFIHQYIGLLKEKLEQIGSSLLVKHGNPKAIWKELTEKFEVEAVYTNHDYEPYALERDAQIKRFLASKGIKFHTYKDQCIFEKDEVVKNDGKPYTVFTPYSRKWIEKFQSEKGFYARSYPTEKYSDNYLQTNHFPLPTLQEIGFEEVDKSFFPERKFIKATVENYEEQRDIPSVAGTTRLSVHLRFGTVSIRHLAQKGYNTSQKWLNELIWRDFYMMILHHFPQVVKENFKSNYDFVPWRNNEEEFAAWCEGRTGYPIIDAGMRELNETGFMHNRVRMIVASFLTKHLLIDWRWGEAYFAEKLLDFELASNNGGWQWAAGTGTDAQPYFRVFNPYSQTDKFDKDLKYIRKWIPELDTDQYPEPIVEHKPARERAIETYKKALEEAKGL
ncbi:deoxyribodipyrimidine photo-lyase [Flammeovirgaceae bacterium SG7u.111]|nr:deoxyribodipyrimidine photo-lyase [Flammeovirgaceae bacterium SG7u.132]WPO38281.1 deoxyribodipyrimidine photo-lyase [Flammeovirgaceae bacterium SG7u.111]